MSPNITTSFKNLKKWVFSQVTLKKCPFFETFDVCSVKMLAKTSSEPIEELLGVLYELFFDIQNFIFVKKSQKI